jgi:hypothetical protein
MALMMALIQDFMGMEAYIAHLRAGWIDVHWTVWLIPIFGISILEWNDENV